MVKFLINRPIAVIITTISLVILGLITFPKIPVSLLPDIAVPEITVQISYPSASAKELNQTITKPILNQLQQVNHLADIEAESRDGFAVLKLSFDFGTNINLAYIEANEKIDAITGNLSRDLPRPLVIKAGATDIPVFNLNVWENPPSQQNGGLNNEASENNFLQLSEFCENVLKRRIEQTREVALVDITGLSRAEVVIIPNQATMQSLGISEQELTNILQENNIDLGNFVVKDGQYQYNIRFSSVLKSITDIENIYFKKGDRVLQIKQLASVKLQEQKLKGIYKYNGHRAVCMSIIKQSDTQLLNLQKELDKEIKQYKKDYPNLNFAISQDQTELLNVAINNLTGNIIFGGLCTFIMIFFFMNDFKAPVLVGLVLPISLVITFLFFYLFNISINIVSLAGLVLGVGEIIDSAIIVIENIEDHRKEGSDLETSCINGTEEVIRPLFTSILTNSAVFLPLLFMSGLAGALFYDQALAVTLSLGISLLCSYTLVPVLYRLFYKKQTVFNPKTTFVARKANEVYDWFFDKVFRYKKSFLIFFIIVGLSFIPLFMVVQKQGMPTISHTELEAKIDWNEPITVFENDKRLVELIKSIKTKVNYESSFVGQQQFLLNRELQQNYNESLLSIKVESNEAFEQLKAEIGNHLKANYPNAVAEVRATKNIFEQLFNSTETPLRAKITRNINAIVPNIDEISTIYKGFERAKLNTNAPALQNRIFIKINPEKLLLYKVSYETVYQKLKTIFNENIVGNLKSEQKFIPILISDNSQNTNSTIQNATVKTKQGNFISLNQLIEFSNQQDYKSYFQSKEGSYIPFDFGNENVVESQVKIKEIIAMSPNVSASYSGSYFKNEKLINELLVILLVAIGLLYFILTAQFESLTQPLIVMLTLIFGITGALAMLFIYGNSLNIMSAIGMIVLIGILDNDSILKIDTMNRSTNSLDLISAIKSSGKKRLKSQLMTFLTTILGLLPVLFSGGLGSELQKPLALSVIGGMCLGLFISLSLIPLLYWFSAQKKVHKITRDLYVE
jgi:multidrug efflux pump subunit AcrB